MQEEWTGPNLHGSGKGKGKGGRCGRFYDPWRRFLNFSPRSLSPKHIEAAMSHMRHVAGDAIWLKNNPGRQDSLLTGSFQPMSR